MWKRFKESTGFNWNFVTNIFRRRSYSKFDTDEDASRDYRCPQESFRDEENNEICWNDRQHLESPEGESGYGSVCTTPHNNHGLIGQSINTDQIDSRYQQQTLFDNHAHKNARSFGIYGKDRPTSSFDSVSTSDRTFRSVSYKVKGDVKDVVNSYVQRKYNRLDNDDDEDGISDENVEIEGSENNENRDFVFHSAKEIHPECRDKPKRLTKKKIKKRTGRIIRSSWKWVKRGCVEYARSFNTPNVFILANPGIYRKRM